MFCHLFYGSQCICYLLNDGQYYMITGSAGVDTRAEKAVEIVGCCSNLFDVLSGTGCKSGRFTGRCCITGRRTEM